jgi:hypothetical protein
MTEALTALAATRAKRADQPLSDPHYAEARSILIDLQDIGWVLSPDLVFCDPDRRNLKLTEHRT